MKRCAFCSMTEKDGRTFFKGLLSPLICEECIKKIIDMIFEYGLEKMGE